MCHSRESRPCRAQEVADVVVAWQRGEIEWEVIQWRADLKNIQVNYLSLMVFKTTPRDKVVRLVREALLLVPMRRKK